MAWRWLADATVTLHAVFIAFVVLGGFAVARNARWAWLHVPAVAWVVYLELTGAICPLTPLENALRTRAGEEGYAGGFIDHYLMPVIYPAGLTPSLQVLLGAGALVLNVIIYAWIWRRRRSKGELR
ncbi:MAG TPA: DUF2784 domain-containing protein [Casimicrobiaceae bacterium]|nr:DUF2784 domain-containing protein [Casimicrobiaceae bacterium]